MKVSSVVCNYRTPTDLGQFCLSYDGDEGDELFIVNVAPEQPDIDVAKEWCERLDAHYIEFEENVGYAKGVNRALRIANGEVFAIFNADVKLRPGVLHECAGALLSQPSWGTLGPLQVDDRGRCTHPGIFGTLDKPEWRPGGWLAPVQPEWREIRDDAVTVVGSAHWFKKSVWRELEQCPIYQRYCKDEHLISEGAYLPTFLTYEETWANYHCISHGYKVVFYGLAEIVHNWHGSVKQNRKEAEFSRAFHDAQKVFHGACASHGIPCDV